MANFIHDIEITNFKSIRHQKIEGCKRINVFIGYPNVGKSNILESMSLFGYSQRDTPQLSSLVRVQDAVELFFDGNVSTPVEVTVNGNDKVSLNFFSDEEVSLIRVAQIEMQQQWKKIADSQVHLKQQYEIAQNSSGNVHVEVVGNPNYSRIAVKKYHYYSDISPTHKGYQVLFFPRGENLFFILETTPALRKDVATIFREYGLRLAFTKGEKYSLKVLKTLQDDTIFLIPFYQIADTLQRLIFYKAAIASNKDAVLLFEEPEAHMFPPYIRKLTWDIISSKTNQFFIATHSPFVLDELMEEAAEELSIYLVDYQDGETKIQLLSEENLKEVREYGVDLFFNIESYLKRGQSHSA